MNTASANDIGALGLHDATLNGVEILWKEGRCLIHLNVWSDQTQSSTPCTLEFVDVTSVVVPKSEPWGPSVSVNNAKFSDGKFNIEMQSGDIIAVTAKSFSLQSSNPALKQDAPSARPLAAR